MVDVAPTVLAHLRVKIASAWNLDGHPVGLKLTGEDGLAECSMDLLASQDPENLFPILPEELEAGPSPEAENHHPDALALEAAKLAIAHMPGSSPKLETEDGDATAAADSKPDSSL